MSAHARRLERRLAVLTWVIMAVGVGSDLLLTGWTSDPDRLAVSVFCAVFFAVLLVRLAVGVRGRRRNRFAIGVLALGVVSWAAESTILQAAQNSGHGEHLATGEWAYLVTYLVFVVYLLLDSEHRPAKRISTWLETATICAGSASLSGTLLLTPLAAGKPGNVSLLVALVYPVADGVLGLLVLAQIGLRMRAANLKSLQLLAGFVLLAFADVSFVGNVLHGSSGSTVLTIVLWGAGFAELVAAACRRVPQTATAPAVDLPAIVIVGAMAAAIAVLVIRPADRLGEYLVAAAIGTLLAGGARMTIAMHDARRAADELEAASIDPLTTLPNRRGILARIDEDLATGQPLALMILDLDGFKDFNDALGHSTGDGILQLCARRLRGDLPAHALLARLGGDEFAIVLREEEPLALIEAANEARAAICEPTIAHGIEIVVTASVGIATRLPGDSDSSALLRRADVAMYQAKQLGTGARLYDAARDEFSRDRLRMVEELRRGIDEDQLVLWYQPQVDAATQRVCGVEALVRWRHPRRGILPPIAFLPIARQAGLMPALSEAVIRRAAADLRSWKDVQLGFPVSINCPPPELLSGVFARALFSVVEESGLRPSDFVVEVTEDSFISDPERARDIVASFREAGLHVSIDDYGVGFSSLAYLRDLPVDELKIDRSFISTMIGDPRSRSIVESTVRMAHALDLRVVAEGVEDAATAAMLVAMGGDAIQGYHYARPMPGADFIEWVREWRTGLADVRA